MGSNKSSARIGRARGTLFKKGPGDLYWFDHRVYMTFGAYEGVYRYYCLGAVLDAAKPETDLELRNMMRGIKPAGRRPRRPNGLGTTPWPRAEAD